MELIERYIYEVGRYLPRKTRADIQAELRSSLLDALEEGGEASDERVVALLKEFGPPRQVAASYQPGQEYLIGPELYPLFRMVVGIVSLALLGSILLSLGIGAFFGENTFHLGEPLKALDLVSDLLGRLVSAFGMTVLAFAILQRFGVRPESDESEWEPRDLPPVAEEVDQVDRRGTIIGLAFSLAILAILWFFPDKIGVVLTWGQDVLVNPVIVSHIPLISFSILLGMALELVLLRQGRWSTATRIAKIGVNLVSIYVLCVLVVGHSAWLAANGSGGFFDAIELLAGSDPATATLTLGMHAFRLAFGIAMIVISIETLGLIYRLVKRAVAPASPIAIAKNTNAGG